MTINELKQLSKGRWDGKMKRKVVIERLKTKLYCP
jgi:hypothetical protein